MHSSNASVVGRRLSRHARVSASWLWTTSTTVVDAGPARAATLHSRTAALRWAATHPNDGDYRSDNGTYLASVGPAYSARGRIKRLLPCCSRTCAAQPETRLSAKIGVN